MTNKEFGDSGEQLAVEHLIRKGYKILATNWRYHHLELDIVAEYGNYVVFCEVKTRSSVKYINPEDAVNFPKMTRILHAAEAYIAINRIRKQPRFDIIAISPYRERMQIKHIEDAFISPVY